MISFIRGKLVDVFENKVIVDTGSFGMEINVTTLTLEKLPKVNEEVFLYTYFKVSEDAMSLYGFNNGKELEIFKLLLGVNGVGPKAALSILSVLDVYSFGIAVLGDDEKTIAKANGVGLKTAKRIIIELKDKIHTENITEFDAGGSNDENTVLSTVGRDTIEALVALGYSVTEATKAVKSLEIDENMSSSKALRLALRML
jgi:holliday junction DNA helicase ruvA